VGDSFDERRRAHGRRFEAAARDHPFRIGFAFALPAVALFVILWWILPHNAGVYLGLAVGLVVLAIVGIWQAVAIKRSYGEATEA
jgi:Flp pilus assembly protein TadB